jgi:acetyl esterase/lipase
MIMKPALAMFVLLVWGDCGLGTPHSLRAQTSVPESVTFEKEIEYSHPGDESMRLNMARPKESDSARPVVICIHGGGFRAGKRERWDGLCLRLAEKGFVAVTISYRLAPKYQFPAAVHDCKAAVRWLRANAEKYGIDEKRIGVLGDSAGGHLAQLLAVSGDVPELEGDGGNANHSSRVSCVANIYGTSDLSRSYGRSVDAGEVLPLWFGGNVIEKRRSHILASPLYWVTPSAAPTLLLHGTEDKYVNYEQAVWMFERLQAADVEVQLVTFPGAGHGFQAADLEKADQLVFEFLTKRLKP